MQCVCRTRPRIALRQLTAIAVSTNVETIAIAIEVPSTIVSLFDSAPVLIREHSPGSSSLVRLFMISVGIVYRREEKG